MNKPQEESHIDVRALMGKLWSHRLTFLLVWVGTIVIVGAGTYLLPRKWQSSIKIVPEYNLQETMALRTIFAELGTSLQISAMGDAIAPDSYIDVISDAHFLSELSQQIVTDQDSNQHKIVDLYPNTSNEGRLFARMREDIVCKPSRKDASIVISVSAHDPAIAQQMVELVCNQLSDNLSRYRQEKAQRNLDYYAQLSDKGPIAEAMYEIAKVRLHEHQPMFVVLQHAEMPIRAISPKRVTIVGIAWLLVTLGMVIFYWRKDIPEWL